jgi:NAD(P)-dependent dehydrogenase (short-subunit alcohol dehydrogenase family)
MLGAYSISKAALIHMTRVLARELAADNIRVNAVAPGLIDTKFSQALMEDKNLYKAFVNATALRRHGQPEEIAPAVVMFASNAGSFVTGQVLVLDGGGRM